MDALASLCTEDVEAIPFDNWPGDRVYNGRANFIRLASEWWENFSGTHMKIERLIDEGDRIILLITHTATVEGLHTSQPVGALIDLRDGLMRRLRFEIGFEKTLALAKQQ